MNPKELIDQRISLTITFVTDGIESAIEKAKSAAGHRDVTVVGGCAGDWLRPDLAWQRAEVLRSTIGEGNQA